MISNSSNPTQRMTDIHEIGDQQTNHEDEHENGHLNLTLFNSTGIDLNSPEWIAIRVSLVITIIIEVFVAAIIIDLLHRKKLISEVVLRVIGSLTAGLMLSGGLVHIYAEAVEHYVESTEHPNFIIPFLIGALTIMCLIVIDKLISVAMLERKHYIDRKERNLTVVSLDSANGIELENVEDKNHNLKISECSEHKHEADTQGHSHFDMGLGTDKWYVVIVFLMAISLHSLFAGLGFGTTKNYKIMFQIYAFIVLHKGLVAASLCVVMLKHKKIFTVARYYLVVITFSVATPIGASIGIGISNIEFELEIVEVVFNCISAGTFLYLSIRELIAMFFDQAESKWWIDIIKMIAFIIGFSFLTGIAIWHPHEEQGHAH